MADDKDNLVPEETREKAENAPKAEPKKKGPRKVHRIVKTEAQKQAEASIVYPDSPVSDEALERLARLMNDSPTIKKLHGTTWEIHALKPGTQWLIAEEACKIVKQDNASMGDVIKQFATNMPAVCRCLALALLNRKEWIYGDEYQRVYDTLMWGDYDLKDWATLLFEVISLVDINFFFASTGAIQTVRAILNRKTTATERASSQPARSGGK